MHIWCLKYCNDYSIIYVVETSASTHFILYVADLDAHTDYELTEVKQCKRVKSKERKKKQFQFTYCSKQKTLYNNVHTVHNSHL